ncbi:MAG TPA: hypothetical protein VJH23_04775 [archaeon]|nr:hypothetical protein [archaeon]
MAFFGKRRKLSKESTPQRVHDAAHKYALSREGGVYRLGFGALAGTLGGLASTWATHSPDKKISITLASILGGALAGATINRFFRKSLEWQIHYLGETLHEEYYSGKSDRSEQVRALLNEFKDGWIIVDKDHNLVGKSSRLGIRRAIKVSDVLEGKFSKPFYSLHG